MFQWALETSFGRFFSESRCALFAKNALRCLAMNIRSTRIDELATRLARLTGENIETALERAIEERLSRVGAAAPAGKKAALESFFDQISRMRVLDTRSVDEIIGYGPDGLPA
jgi:antitoxin VapB